MNVQFIECIATPAFDDLMSLYLYVPGDFFLSLLNISVTKRERNKQSWSEVRNAKQIRREKTKPTTKTKHKIPNTKNVTYESEKDNQREKKLYRNLRKEKTYMYMAQTMTVQDADYYFFFFKYRSNDQENQISHCLY